MTEKHYIPTPVFGSLNEIIDQYKTVYDNENPHQVIRNWLNHCFEKANRSLTPYAHKDYQMVLNFLYSYRGSSDTFKAYRRDLERLIQWSWIIRNQSVLDHKREDIEAFIDFCLKPPKRWIGLKTVARFKPINGERRPNPEWRPFEARINKKDHKDGLRPEKSAYQFSQQALKVMFTILSSFYTYLLQEEVTQTNPFLLIRQKSKFIRKEPKTQVVRRLSNTQWETVINLVKENAAQNTTHERTVFILSCLFGMYLRISELTASPRWTPTMGNFFKDTENHWWFKTVGKGNKARQIAVSNAMLDALKHYRINYLKLPPFPSIDEKTPLISHAKSPLKPIRCERPIRQLVQECFDQAAEKLTIDSNLEEAESLRAATVHWLRHTGISEDVKHRPREHVRDDAGHSSSATTDRYVDIELRERAKSAKNKAIV